MSEYVAGVDLGGTNVRTGIVTREGELIARDERESHAEQGPEGVMAAIEASVDGAVASAGVGRERLLAVGVGAPGPMNWQTGVVYSPPNLPGWSNVPLADLMTKRLGVRTIVENDANVACYGEYWSGAGRDVQTMCVLTLGTGLGGGLVIDGRLWRGIDGTAAEIGHMCLEMHGRKCGCGARGCIEQYCSVSGMLRTAYDGLKRGKNSLLNEMCGGNIDTLTGRMVSDAAQAGDTYAQEVLHQTGVWLGTGIASLVNLLNPEMVVLYGGLTAAGERLLEPTRATALKQCFEVPGKRAQIVLAQLGGDGGIIGAAGCALERVGAALEQETAS
jgi:glucokinase